MLVRSDKEGENKAQDKLELGSESATLGTLHSHWSVNALVNPAGSSVQDGGFFWELSFLHQRFPGFRESEHWFSCLCASSFQGMLSMFIQEIVLAVHTQLCTHSFLTPKGVRTWKNSMQHSFWNETEIISLPSRQVKIFLDPVSERVYISSY